MNHKTINKKVDYLKICNEKITESRIFQDNILSTVPKHVKEDIDKYMYVYDLKKILSNRNLLSKKNNFDENITNILIQRNQILLGLYVSYIDVDREFYTNI